MTAPCVAAEGHTGAVEDGSVPTNPGATAPTFVSLRVSQVRRDTDDSVVVRFDTGADPRFRFSHGQHLTLRRDFDGVEARRSYSICAPAPKGPLQVAIKRVQGGVFSTWANTELAVGEELDVMTPTGRFTHELDSQAARCYALVAAGSGITPVLSIAATILHAESRSQVSLLVINRTSASIMLLSDIEALRNRFLGRVQISHLLTREHSEVPLLSARPDRHRFESLCKAGLLPAQPDEVFVCGPVELVRIVRRVYETAGINPAHVHDELFTTAQTGRVRSEAPHRKVQAPAAAGTGIAILHGRETTFDFGEDDTVLEATSRTRPDVPFSCRAGVCSTCRARLVSGSVTMAVTHGLVPGEKEAGYILSCQAIPTTPHVRVDFDA